MQRVSECLKTTDLNSSLVIRILFALRGIPMLLRVRGHEPMTLDALVRGGFILLGERPGDELVLGLVARPWTPSAGVRRVAAGDFASFAEPGFAKVAWNFKLEQVDDVVRLSSETRVLCVDGASRAQFRIYWTLVRGFSGLIRMEMLRAFRRCAQRR